MNFMKHLLVLGALLALCACGNNNTTAAVIPGFSVVNLNGGNGGTLAGGNGGSITSFKNFSSVHGDLKFHATGTVDATFILPTFSPNFGNLSTATTVAKTIAAGSDVPVAVDPVSPAVNDYFVKTSDHNLYFQTATGAKQVTGLTVRATAFFRLPDDVLVQVSDAVVINGTVTGTTPGRDINLHAGSFLQVNGTVSTTPTVAGTGSGHITLSSGGILINQGSVESNGADGSGAATPGGSSGGVTLSAENSVYNVVSTVFSAVTVSAKGGANATGTPGKGGTVLLQSTAASVHSSGGIDASGGNGTTGGTGGSITLIGGSATNVGRVAVEGTVTSNGGVGSSGDGGNGGAMSLNSFSGGILINAVISATGGEGKVSGNGGNGGSLGLNNSVGSDAANQHQLSPEGIKVTGNITLNGGQGGAQGGQGGTLSFTSAVADNALTGFANVEFFGYQSFTLVGGNSTEKNGGNGGTVQCDLQASINVLGVDFPPGAIYNEVPIIATGGANTAKSAGSTGGTGGSVRFTTPQNNGPGDPLRTILTNLASLIDVSGGAAETGGAQGKVTMKSFGNLINGGAITAIGGAGSKQGGGILGKPSDDANILVTLSSTNSVNNSNVINVSGGAGATGGNAGGVKLASGTQTIHNQSIAANGGATSATHGGNGGFISLSSQLLLTSIGFNGHMSVATGGSGGTIGTVLLDGADITSASGVI